MVVYLFGTLVWTAQGTGRIVSCVEGTLLNSACEGIACSLWYVKKCWLSWSYQKRRVWCHWWNFMFYVWTDYIRSYKVFTATIFGQSQTFSDKEKGNASRASVKRCFICGSDQYMKYACPRRSKYRNTVYEYLIGIQVLKIKAMLHRCTLVRCYNSGMGWTPVAAWAATTGLSTDVVTVTHNQRIKLNV